ncbi:MAG: ArsR/SmtB family transcription factor [Betaproteobacteria bacterium]
MKSTEATRALAALAQDTRLAVYRRLVRQGARGLAAGEFAGPLEMVPSEVILLQNVLAQAGLITARQDGRYIYYAADYAAMAALIDFLTENCCAADGASCAPTARKAQRKGACA